MATPGSVFLTPHLPRSQVRTWHSLSWPEQSLGCRQETQEPLPSQTRPVPQELPDLTGGFDLTPAVHRSLVHGFLSSGRSVSSGWVAVAPLPSHTSRKQSPVICTGSGVPVGVKSWPHLPCTQVRVWQASSWPAQSAGARHPTQTPLPSQTSPVPQLSPDETGVLDLTPALQASVVQALLSSGRSVSSTALVVPPLPSHWTWWQSPTTCCLTAVPKSTFLTPQAPLSQVRTWHSVS